MSPSILKQINSMAPSRIRKAMSEKAEIVEPFQYYSEVGEQIMAFDFSSHEGNARLYAHFDSEGAKLSQVVLQDGYKGQELKSWFSGLELQVSESVDAQANFAEMMREMHLVASSEMAQLFDTEEMEELSAISEKAPIIIGGCGRSGTTLLLSVLGAHPAILAFPEELYAFYPRPFRLRTLLNELAGHGTEKNWTRWCEKTPKNVRAFAEIEAAFEGNVYLIHIVRDGRDVVTSHHPNAQEKYYVSPERWVADVSAGLEQRDKTLLVRYEDLVTDSEITLREICKFIGEPFDEQMLKFEQHSSVQGNKAWEGGKVQALHQDGMERWRASEYEDRVSELMETAGASELLNELGYA